MKKRTYQLFFCHQTGQKFLYETGWSNGAFFGGVLWAMSNGIGKNYVYASVATAFFVVLSLVLDGGYFVPILSVAALHYYVAESARRNIVNNAIASWNKNFPGLKLVNMGGIIAGNYDEASCDAERSIKIEVDFLKTVRNQDLDTVRTALDILDKDEISSV